MGSIDLATANMYSDEEDLPPPPESGELLPLSPMRDEPMNNDPFDDLPQGGSGGEDGAADNSQMPKRMVRRNPQPKLDSARLTSDRGLPTILESFEKIKFKGKGHECSDLNLMMQTMEHWGNRLFPKMTFDQIIERIEKLGKKRQVQVCVKKIRMDMPLLDDDFVLRAGDEVNEEAEDEPGQSVEDDPLPDLPAGSTTTPGNVSYGNLDISEEQKQKMEENKRKALERRAARMQGSQNASSITANHVPDNTGSSQTMVDNGLDSEEELENEIWKDIITSQQTSTQRPHSNHSSKDVKGEKPLDNHISVYDDELDRETSKSFYPCAEYDEETDDDSEYEGYLEKLKATKIQTGLNGDGIVLNDVMSKNTNMSVAGKNDCSESVDDNEESAPLFRYGNPAIENMQDDSEHQSQSILGKSCNSEEVPSCKNTKEKQIPEDESSLSGNERHLLQDQDMRKSCGSEEVPSCENTKEKQIPADESSFGDNERHLLQDQDMGKSYNSEEVPSCKNTKEKQIPADESSFGDNERHILQDQDMIQEVSDSSSKLVPGGSQEVAVQNTIDSEPMEDEEATCLPKDNEWSE